MPQPHESNGQHPAFYINERWGGRAKPQLGQIELNCLRHDIQSCAGEFAPDQWWLRKKALRDRPADLFLNLRIKFASTAGKRS
jgi:hypothetical protein